MLNISIITKTYNRLPMLLECIESVQNLRNEPHDHEVVWEHLIYDDGSDDGTEEHFSTKTYPNTRYIHSTENTGIPIAGNSAIATCKSAYIFELDSDDVVPQRFLTNVYDTLQEYQGADWIVADFYRMGEEGSYVVGDDYYGWRYSGCDEILSAIFSNNHFIQHNVVYQRELWEKVGRYDETLVMAEDLDLYVRFLFAGKMPQYVPYISHFHRLHLTNVSRDVHKVSHQKDLATLYKKYQKTLVERGIICPFV